MSKEQEKRIVRGTRAETWDVPPSDEDYTLEEILAEYGSSRQQKILEEVDRELQPETAEESPADNGQAVTLPMPEGAARPVVTGEPAEQAPAERGEVNR